MSENTLSHATPWYQMKEEDISFDQDYPTSFISKLRELDAQFDFIYDNLSMLLGNKQFDEAEELYPSLRKVAFEIIEAQKDADLVPDDDPLSYSEFLAAYTAFLSLE